MRERESRNKLVGMIIRLSLVQIPRNRDAQNFKNQITSISYLNYKSYMNKCYTSILNFSTSSLMPNFAALFNISIPRFPVL